MIFGTRRPKPVECPEMLEVQKDEVLKAIESNTRAIAELERLNRILHNLLEEEP